MADTLTANNITSLSATLKDRRRLGRADYQDPHLIALLRGQPVTDTIPAGAEAAQTLPLGDMRVDEDCLDVSRGILNAAVIGVAMWAAIIFSLCHFL